MSFFPYDRVSDFFEAEGDFEENLDLDYEPDALDQQRADALEWEQQDIDPCCLLYFEPYLVDHEYGCPRRVAKDRV